MDVPTWVIVVWRFAWGRSDHLPPLTTHGATQQSLVGKSNTLSSFLGRKKFGKFANKVIRLSNHSRVCTFLTPFNTHSPLTHPLIHSSIIHSPTHSLPTHSFTHSLTHSPLTPDFAFHSFPDIIIIIIITIIIIFFIIITVRPAPPASNFPKASTRTPSNAD